MLSYDAKQIQVLYKMEWG